MVRFIVYALVLIALSIVFAYAEDCSPTCTDIAWELQINGYAVEGLGDMDEDQCDEALFELEDQIPAFTPAECVDVPIKREEM